MLVMTANTMLLGCPRLCSRRTLKWWWQDFYSGRECWATTEAQLGRALRKLPVTTCQQPSRWWNEKVSDFGQRRCLYKGRAVRTSSVNAVVETWYKPGVRRLIKAHSLRFLVDPVAKQMLRERSWPWRGSFTVPQTLLYGPFAEPILGPPRCVCHSLSPSLGCSFISDSSPHQMEGPFQAEGITNSSIFPSLVLGNPLLCDSP